MPNSDFMQVQVPGDKSITHRALLLAAAGKATLAVDDLNAAILGSRPTMSHATAQLEVQGLIAALFAAREEGGGVAEADAA